MKRFIGTISVLISVLAVSAEALAQTYATGVNASSSTVVAPAVNSSVTDANVGNVNSHLDVIVSAVSLPAPGASSTLVYKQARTLLGVA